jgi:ACS family glucarate transporter-like MFS transporter
MAMGLAWGVVSLVVLRLLLGIGESPAFPSSAQVVSRWFPRSERSFASATFNNGNPVGAPLLIAGGVALIGAAVYAFLLPPVRRLRME